MNSRKQPKKTPSTKSRSPRREIHDYDDHETASFIDQEKPLRLADLGLALPAVPPTQVVSIRLPSSLINELRAIASQQDIAYQALIKMFLADSVEDVQRKKKRRRAA